jgi:hypothetical protein
MSGKRRALAFAIVLGTGVIAAVAYRNATEGAASYPVAELLGNESHPMWSIPAAELGQMTTMDAQRLLQLEGQLARAVTNATARREVLGRTTEQLTVADREELRSLFWSFVEPLLALDELKHRYEAWYGIDYRKQSRLHAQMFSIAFASLCVQVNKGQAWLDLVGSNTTVASVFDEAIPELGIPRGMFTSIRGHLGRTRDLSYVPLGAEWYDAWIGKHLSAQDGALRVIVEAQRDTALKNIVAGQAVVQRGKNKVETVKGKAFRKWFPVQKEISEWAGDTRVAPQERRLIDDSHLAEMSKAMKPGDIVLERRNWYLSNIGLPGFWPHAVIFTGTPTDIRESFDEDADVRTRYGGKFSEYLARKYPKVWATMASTDLHGKPMRVIEAISEGVSVASFEHSCGADYVAALRPNVPRVTQALAIERAISYVGRPYDFDFNFTTDDQLVCSELVVKAYEPDATSTGIRPVWARVAGRSVVTPTELAKLFTVERALPHPQLSFVYFLEGQEREHTSRAADADALAATLARPKWDIAQP